MAVKTKTAAASAEKWQRIASNRSADYEAGVKGAGADWEKNTLGAVKAFVSGVTAGNVGQMFAGGVRKAGAAKFERKAAGVGKDRYSGGINAAVSDYQAGVDPFLALNATLTPPARGMRGDTANIEIVRYIGDAYHKKRIALRSAGG